MKPNPRLISVVILLIIGIMINIVILHNNEQVISINLVKAESLSTKESVEIASIEETRIEVYDNMTIEELSEKLEDLMENELDGYGQMFAEYCIDLGLDPYLALAVVLHETGCKWNCSYLASKCNNFGGQKGSVDGKSCGSYKHYPTREDGLKGFIDNLFYNYYDIGLTTPEAINKKYAESTTWAIKINKYIEQIKES